MQWTLDEARARNAPVRLICAHRWALPYQWDGMHADVTDPEVWNIQGSADDLVAKTIVVAAGFARDIEVTGEAIEGDAAQVLVDASAHATVLVLGSRHLKALGSVLLRSIGTGVAARAACPVVVVRGAAGRPAPPIPTRAEAWLSEALAGWRENYPDVPADGVVVSHHPVSGLVVESAGQHLLVVRSRTRHALAGALLGSVGQGVLHHATCPVAVIPAAAT